MKTAAACMLFIMSVSVASLQAGDLITLSKPFAVVGEPITIDFESANPADTELHITYQPNSATEKKEIAGAFDQDGTRVWEPLYPGLATLQVKNKGGDLLASLEIAICFSEIPKSGIGVMLFAGLLLFGGAGLSLYFALRKIK
ncbi:MAG: hypothetical protein ABIK28_18915 [Planctomycetota bacterium]